MESITEPETDQALEPEGAMEMCFSYKQAYKLFLVSEPFFPTKLLGEIHSIKGEYLPLSPLSSLPSSPLPFSFSLPLSFSLHSSP